MYMLNTVLTHRGALSAMAIACVAYTASALIASNTAEAKIYRCGNEYTNDASYAMKNGCKAIAGGNVTIVQGTRSSSRFDSNDDQYSVSSQLRKKKRAALPKTVREAKPRRVSNAKQRKRDNDTRLILQEELTQAKKSLTELEKEYNNGQPERWGSERNYQKYLDRVAKMREDIERRKTDIEGLQREIARVPGGAAM